MKRLIAFCIIICCILLVGCKNDQEIVSRLEAEAKSQVENNVLGEWMAHMRACGIDDLEAEVVLSDTFYDKETKTYMANFRLMNFGSENSAERLAENPQKLCKILEKTLDVYNSYGGETYEWTTDNGQIIKLDAHVSNNTEINIDDSDGKSFGIRNNFPSGTIEYFENGQVVDLASIKKASKEAEEANKEEKTGKSNTTTEKTSSSVNNSASSSDKTNKKICSDCGRKEKCARCDSTKIYHCNGYRHYCESCWREKNEHDDDYWDDDYYDDYDDWHDDYYDDDDYYDEDCYDY